VVQADAHVQQGHGVFAALLEIQTSPASMRPSISTDSFLQLISEQHV
jgi:hypothetical protein